ncbi:hypothetical protein FEM48_Zijuj11G0032000 [Ziziphus jujuba var. spinosa]|uniref:EGF-like domain-containing protein n=1 Tax=Ziziphus jujuba var. spinosa TaxID=714518 RepID=A0A978UGH1_ZIZJJ|nr:hypothetical protein FEM48_Zijuj11G0032000 [Ziziphus jujuba var. spinosa]
MKFSKSLCVFFFFFYCYFVAFGSSSSSSGKTSRISGFNVPSIELQPYEWTYIRGTIKWLFFLVNYMYMDLVELPQVFSSASIAIDSDVNLDLKIFYLHPDKSLPIICFRNGGPPLPDFSKASLKALVMNQYNGSAENIQYLQNVDQCYPVQKKIRFKLLYGQVSYANVTVEGCSHPAMQGQHCDQTVEDLSDIHVAYDGHVLNFSRNLCLVKEEPKVYSFDTYVGLQMTISAKDFSFNQTLSNSTRDANELSIMFYARFNGIPDNSLYDYSYDLTKGPLVIPIPKSGMWYFSIQATYGSKVEIDAEVCTSVEWKMVVCPEKKDGPNCVYEEYTLKGVYQNNPTVPQVYFPDSKHVDTKLTSFPLEPLLSKSSDVEKSGYAWTYFDFDTPQHIEGKNIHIQLLSDTRLNYEIYIRFNGLPTVDMWDISYSNQTAKSKNNSMVKLYDSTEQIVNLYVLYPRNEFWVIGLRHPVSVENSSRPNTRMSVSAKWCPNKCSNQGTYQACYDGSRTIYYHYCSCDRNHGGFDCSVDLFSRAGRIWHRTCIIGSNVAAILPAFKALQQKVSSNKSAYIDILLPSTTTCNTFVKYFEMNSTIFLVFDITSPRTARFLPFPSQIQNFMDFWLSFLAVMSTFVYLCNVSEAAKRTMHTIASISSALLALTGATRSSNIPIVLSMGAAGLLIGWLTELCRVNKLSSSDKGTMLSFPKRRQNVKVGFVNIGKTLYRYFCWVYVVLGFVAFSIAAISRENENSQNYWILHSLWHVSIYTSAFFFFCSKESNPKGDLDGGPRTASSYETVASI